MVYHFFINGNKIEENEVEQKLSELFSSKNGDEANNRAITVKKKQGRKVRKDEELFLDKIPHINKAKVMKMVVQNLTDTQKSKMKTFVQSSIEDEQDVKIILSTLNDQQMDKLLLDIQKTDQMKVLEYLLRKNDQWTEISEIVVKSSSHDTRDRQIRRLINKQKNSFSEFSETDNMVLELFKKNQDALLEDLLTSLNAG